MKITEYSVRKSMTVFVLMFAVVLIGAGSYIELPREASPDVKIPFVMVYAPYYGTSPEDMENLVTRKLEKQLKGLNHLKEMTSTSSEGVSSIVLEFQSDVEMSDALQKVRDAAEMAKPDLPQDVRDDMLVQELSSEEWPIMQVVLSAEYDPVRLKDTAEDLQEEIEQVPGVLEVDLTGGVEREVRVDVDPDRMRFYDLSLQDIMDAVMLENVTFPGGDLAVGSYEYQVRVPGEFESVDEISSVLLNPAAPTPVYLRDVAKVTLGIADRTTISRKNGVEAVTLSVKKRSGENIIEIADSIEELLAEFSFPEGTKFTITGDQSVVIKDMVAELENNILSGLILVVAVLFLFLGWTNSLFVGAAIPFSMLITFGLLRALGYTLNMVVLFSLILALGMLVDNAIVIVENIFRHRSEGMGRVQASLVGSHEVSAAVIASSLTTVSAFLPLVFWPGIMGEFMKYLPITVILALLASLVVALVFNPVLCASFMSVPKPPKRGKDGRETVRLGDRLMGMGLRSYEPTLRWALAHRALILIVSVVTLLGVTVVFGMFNAGVELFPDVEPTYASVKVNAPSGTRIEVSDSYAHTVEAAIGGLKDLKAYVTQVGAATDGMGVSQEAPANSTLISLEFIDQEDRTLSSRDQLETLRTELAGFTGAEISVDKQEEGPPTGKPVNIEISGRSFATLGGLAERIKDQIRGVPGLVDLKDNYDEGRPEIRIRPDLEKAARYGLRRQDVATTVRTAIRGQDVSKYRIGEDEYDIVVRFDEDARKGVEDLEQLTVFYEGQAIPVTAFASISYEAGIGGINRLDARRVVTVSGDVAAGYNENAVLGEVQKQLEGFALPAGYHLAYTGASEDQAEAEEFLSQAFEIALILIFVILVTQFGSVSVPFVIMTSVILSLIGVFLGLLVTRTPFGIIMTGVGVISLAGIVVNNAIVLLDYTIQLREAGHSKLEAIIEAGKTRFRPVILTAVTTVLGLIPLTTGFSVDFGRLFEGDFGRAVIIGGESSQWWGPMGVAVIWGLAVATFLTLVIVPVTYSVFDSLAEWGRQVFGSRDELRTAKRDDAAPSTSSV
ncbi:MAG: efflux RND transporter permease subunit [Candidatus Eisenbacteria bacterium]|uniref:Efflux RND transporter permease subunit n=1 Tax=Eiseniibacteriota bacterium TaxID=2212470 RepID=A0A956NDG8_UNCEI|nr:efflux RND transporter permease subunit [Candidatus Eisenbacteria bacterium]MCB9464960.1 efflux RND transporter permease subunit [Candidatus Eisenbacteria bacterium]